MRIILFISIFLSFFSCIESSKATIEDFKTGSFKSILEDKESVSLAFRNDSIQIETYEGTKDTFDIKWLDQFEYLLVKKNPKTLLDSTPFHVKITSIKDNSYTFSAYYKGSKFKQKGTVFKLDN